MPARTCQGFIKRLKCAITVSGVHPRVGDCEQQFWVVPVLGSQLRKRCLTVLAVTGLQQVPREHLAGELWIFATQFNGAALGSNGQLIVV